MILGSADLPRFSCGCHKLNIVIHHAMNHQIYLVKTIKELNSFSTSIRNFISASKKFRDLKCRPKLENKTRWSSELYMLLSFKI
jgi:hypothetical protein